VQVNLANGQVTERDGQFAIEFVDSNQLFGQRLTDEVPNAAFAEATFLVESSDFTPVVIPFPRVLLIRTQIFPRIDLRGRPHSLPSSLTRVFSGFVPKNRMPDPSFAFSGGIDSLTNCD
jgi:hypothetical protein